MFTRLCYLDHWASLLVSVLRYVLLYPQLSGWPSNKHDAFELKRTKITEPALLLVLASVFWVADLC